MNTDKLLVISRHIARTLLKEGYKMIDIVDGEKRALAFVFENSPELQARMDRLVVERRQQRKDAEHLFR